MKRLMIPLALFTLAACDPAPSTADIPREPPIPEFTLPVDPTPVADPVAAEPEPVAIAPQPEVPAPVAAAPLPEPVVTPAPVAEPEPPALAEEPPPAPVVEAPEPAVLAPLDPDETYQAWLAQKFPHLAGKPLSPVTTPTQWTMETVASGYGPCLCTPAPWATRAAIGDFELQWTRDKAISSGQVSLSIPMMFTSEVMMMLGLRDPHVTASLAYSAIYKPDQFESLVAAIQRGAPAAEIDALVD